MSRNEMLCALTKQSSALSELRLDIAGIWDDQASRDIARRHLDPREEDSRNMLDSLGLQLSSLSDVESKLRTADEFLWQVNDLAHRVADDVQNVALETDAAHNVLERHAKYLADAKAELPIVRKLIESANSNGR